MSVSFLLLFVIFSLVFDTATCRQAFEDPRKSELFVLVKSWNVLSLVTDDSISVELSKGFDDRYDVIIDYGRSSCDYTERVSGNDETDSLIKFHYGPDEMMLYIEGKELLAFVPKYVACGKYHASFHLLLSGAYHLKLSRLRANFDALNENQNRFPPLNLEYLIRDWVELVGSKAKNSVCHRAHYGAWLLKSLLPLSESKPSVYDNITTAQTVRPIRYHGEDRGLDPILMSSVPMSSNHSKDGCVNTTLDYYSYEPVTGCQWEHIAADEASVMLTDKKITLIGDSHMRNFGARFMVWACGVQPFVKDTRTDLKMPAGGRCSGLEFTYIPMYYCTERLDIPLYPDLILVNCGHHPASDDHWSLEKYIKAVTDLAVRARVNPYFTQKRFIWVENTPQPMRNDHWVIEFKDWRTEQRLSMFNNVSTAIFQEHNLGIMSVFDFLLPFVECGCDRAHYVAEGMVYPQYIEFLRALQSAATNQTDLIST